MAFIFCDSMDGYAAGVGDALAGARLKMQAQRLVATPWAIGQTSGRFGGKSLQCGVQTNTVVDNAGCIWKPGAGVSLSEGDTLYMGMWLNCTVADGTPAAVSTAYPLVGLMGTAGAGGSPNSIGILYVDASGVLATSRLFASGTTPTPLATGSLPLLTGTYHWIEFAWTLGSNNNGAVRLLVDDIEQFNVTNISTIVADSTLSGSMWLAPPYGGSVSKAMTCNFDDIVLWDSKGTEFNTFPMGPRRISALKPAGAGDTMNFSAVGSTDPNWQIVARSYQQSPISSYVTDNDDGPKLDLYKVTPSTFELTGINGVVLNHQLVSPGMEVTGQAKVKTGTMLQSQDLPIKAVDSCTQTLFTKDGYGDAWTGVAVQTMQIGQGSQL